MRSSTALRSSEGERVSVTSVVSGAPLSMAWLVLVSLMVVIWGLSKWVKRLVNRTGVVVISGPIHWGVVWKAHARWESRPHRRPHREVGRRDGIQADRGSSQAGAAEEVSEPEEPWMVIRFRSLSLCCGFRLTMQNYYGKMGLKVR